MKFKLTISLDNAAFDDPSELSRILRDVAERLDGTDLSALERPYDGTLYCRDANGNKVGDAKITGRRAGVS